MSTPQQRVANALVELAGVGEPGGFPDVELLAKLADHAPGVVGADACAVVLPPAPGPPHRKRARNGVPETAARPAPEPDTVRVISPHPGLRRLEEDASRRGESPAHTCLRGGTNLPDLPLDGATARSSWPRYTARAREAGFTRVAVLLLPGERGPLGALALLSAGGDAMAPQAMDLGRSLAEVTAHSLVRAAEIRRGRRRVAQLEHALSSRILVEQAKGVLATQHAVPMDRAFELLRGYARAHARLLTEVAHDVITGRLTIRP
ncbi:ANTAR domain-containing protein [Streptomyces sp. NPDC004111]|uniref:ANTAR domain-containing protein n=1 Tax=Streptomyces sp. NPDC004111 TaxID=3364690 RepID=UPI0036C0635D